MLTRPRENVCVEYVKPGPFPPCHAGKNRGGIGCVPSRPVLITKAASMAPFQRFQGDMVVPESGSTDKSAIRAPRAQEPSRNVGSHLPDEISQN